MASDDCKDAFSRGFEAGLHWIADWCLYLADRIYLRRVK